LPRIKKNIGHVFYIKRQFREALQQYRKALDLEPNYPAAHDTMGHAYRALGDYTNAIDEFEKFQIALGKDRALVQKHFEDLRREYAEGGADGYWRKSLEKAQQAGDLYWQAECRARLNDYDQGLTLLEEAYGTNKLPPQSLSWDECWDPVHTDPRFIALLKMTGLKK
jgi:tetratricopeptide (TPR) repeat protein